MIIETRIMVERSEYKTVYTAQYKSKCLFWDIWCNFSVDSNRQAYKAFVNALWKFEKSQLGTKEIAEYMCEEYHRLCIADIEKKNGTKLHEKTNQVSYYKYP